MKILLTGSTGFIGSHLLPKLLKKNYTVYVLTRNPKKIELKHPKLRTLKSDLLIPETLHNIPQDIDIAIYLVHSMKEYHKEFDRMEQLQATHFSDALKNTSTQQIIYISGLHQEEHLSKHLQSRKKVEEILRSTQIPITIFCCSIIIGSGSASFEIIRDLTEKLPIMVAPKWLNQECQPIYIGDVLNYVMQSLNNEKYKNQIFEIAGPDKLTYKKVLNAYAEVRGLKRWIIIVPILTPKLSSLWLQFITHANYTLSRSLVESIVNDSIVKNPPPEDIKLPCISYKEAIRKVLEEPFPRFGSVKIHIKKDLRNANPSRLFALMKKFSKQKNWVTLHWTWNFRNKLDVILGGLGHQAWKQCLFDEKNLTVGYTAKLRMPGEAWLLFSIQKKHFIFESIFLPKGVLGRLYWWSLYPMHQIAFRRLVHKMLALSSKKRS